MTMKTYLALALLVTVLAGNAYGEGEVYYCAETDGNGFDFDEYLNKYKRTGFVKNKFKIKFDRTAKTVEIKGHGLGDAVNGTYPCMVPYAYSRPELLSCSESVYQFNFNSNSGRFVFAMLYGYVAKDGDSISVSYGKCDKF
jgi:hypothetical protein